MKTYMKLSDIRNYMHEKTGDNYSRQFIDRFTRRPQFPRPDIVTPIRLWEEVKTQKWLDNYFFLTRGKDNK